MRKKKKKEEDVANVCRHYLLYKPGLLSEVLLYCSFYRTWTHG